MAAAASAIWAGANVVMTCRYLYGCPAAMPVRTRPRSTSPVRDRDELLARIGEKNPAASSTSIAALIVVIETQDQIGGCPDRGHGPFRGGLQVSNHKRSAIQDLRQTDVEPFLFQLAPHQRVGLDLVATLHCLGESLQQIDFLGKPARAHFLQKILSGRIEHLEIDDQLHVAAPKEQTLAADGATFYNGCHG